MLKNYTKKVKNDDSGAIALMFVLLIVVFMGLLAVVVDVGMLYTERANLQKAADAAVLAGASQLPAAPSAARTIATEYVGLNAKDVDIVEITISATSANNDTIEVYLEKTDVPMLFARALGMDFQTVSAEAAAQIGSPRGYQSGIMPFTLLAQGSMEAPYGFDWAQQLDLVASDGFFSSGNWGWLDLRNFSNRSNLQRIIADGGTTLPIKVGDLVDTSPGSNINQPFNELRNWVSSGPCNPHGIENLYVNPINGIAEKKHLDGTRCRRVVTVPVVVLLGSNPYDWTGVNGKTLTRIVGFANLFIENNPTSQEGILRCRFVQQIATDVVSPDALVTYGGYTTWLKK